MTPAVVSIATTDDLGKARRLVMAWATQLDFNSLERTKLVTAASELGRNALVHGKGGTMTIAQVQAGAKTGLQLEFTDGGPGIPDIAQAMTDGYSTAKSMGVGLGGARRLVSEFEINSRPGEGTRVTIKQWKRR
ncbi:MAG: anti-sigma regulatory factor [Ramlibacter sp.]